MKLLALKTTVKYPEGRWSGNRNRHAYVSIYHELASSEKRNSFKWELSRDGKCDQQGSVGNGIEGQAKGRNLGIEAPPSPPIPSSLLLSLFLPPLTH